MLRSPRHPQAPPTFRQMLHAVSRQASANQRLPHAAATCKGVCPWMLRSSHLQLGAEGLCSSGQFGGSSSMLASAARRHLEATLLGAGRYFRARAYLCPQTHDSRCRTSKRTHLSLCEDQHIASLNLQTNLPDPQSSDSLHQKHPAPSLSMSYKTFKNASFAVS